MARNQVVSGKRSSNDVLDDGVRREPALRTAFQMVDCHDDCFSLSKVDFEDVIDADADMLADLRVAAMRDSLERVGRFDPIRARDRVLSSFKAAFTRHIVVDGARIGFVVVRPVQDELLLDHLYIDPRYQGRGVGAAVLSRVFAEADLQCLDVRVGALKDSGANRFYARHGFEFVEQIDWDVYYVRRHSKTV